MAVVKPFRALRYAHPGPDVVAPPYDVISPEQRSEYLARDPRNVVHLTLPDSEEQAAEALAAWRADGVLVEDATPAMWALEQEFRGPDGVQRTRAGVVAALDVEPYEARIVLPHERTHAAPKEGRLRLLQATQTQLEPIFLLHEGPPLLRGDGAPTLEAEEQGATTRLWRVDEPAEVERVGAALRDAQLLIADGHHRYETAVAFRREGGARSMMVVLVGQDQEGVVIFPTHRLVRGLGEVDGRELPGPPPAPPPGLVLYRDGRYLLVDHDAETDPEAVAAVDRDEADAAFLLRPVTVEQVRAVAERGDVMPQKSTYFYPKLLSGLLFHPV